MPDFPPIPYKHVDFPRMRLINFPLNRRVDFPPGVIGESYRKRHEIIGSSGGAQADYQVKIKAYNNVAPDVWVDRQLLPYALADSTGVDYNGKFYTFGGYGTSDTDRKNYCLQYDPVSDVWSEKTPMTFARWGAAAAVHGGYAYVFAGNDGVNHNRVERYNFAGDSWETLNNFPVSCQGLMAVTVGDKIYLFYHGSTREYDPALDSYTSKTAAPVPVRWACCAYVVVGTEKRIYIIGGYRSDTAVSTNLNYYYRPDYNDWSGAQANAPYAALGILRDNPVYNSKIYYGFGYGYPLSEFYTHLYRYDPATNSWSAALPEATYARDSEACAVINGVIYAAGGRNVTLNPYGLKYHEAYNIPGGDFAYLVGLNGHVQNDFDDVRFTDEDGVTPLPYWLETKVNGNYAIFWVKVPSIPASPSTKSIYIYYNKSDAVYGGSIANTFPIFAYDADSDPAGGNPTGWTISEPAGTDVRVSNAQKVSPPNSMELYDNSGTNYCEAMKDYSHGDKHVFSWQARMAKNNVYAFSILRTIAVGSAVIIRWNSSGQIETYDGGYVVLQNYLPNTWYKITAVVRPATGKFDIYINDLLKRSNCSFLAAGTPNQYTTYTEGATTNSLFEDDLRIRKLVEPEPAHKLWDVEESAGWIF